MSTTAEIIIVAAIVLIAAVQLWRTLRRRSSDECGDCPISDRCGKKQKH